MPTTQTISELQVRLTAQSDKFKTTMGAAASQVDKFSGAVKHGRTMIASFAAAATAAASAGGLALIVKGQLKAIDSTAKLSRMLDISTKQLKSYELLAELSGTSIETFSKGIVKMSRNIGEANAGLGTARRFLDEMGLSAADLAVAGTDEALKQIADGLKIYTTQAQKAAVISSIFGRAGVELIPMLEGGRAGLEAAVAEAEALGITFNNIDAAKVELANDSISRLKTVMQGAAQTLTIELAPFIMATADSLKDFGIQGEGAGERIVNGLTWATKAVAKLADTFGLVKQAWLFAQRSVLMGIQAATNAFEDITKVTGKWIALMAIPLGPGITKQIRELAESGVAGDFAKELQKDIDALDDQMAAIATTDYASQVEGFFQSIKDGAEEAAMAIAETAEPALEGLVENFAELQKKAEGIIAATRTPFEKFQTKIEEIQEVAKAGLIDPETTRRALKKAFGEFQTGELKKQLEDLKTIEGTKGMERLETGEFQTGSLQNIALSGPVAAGLGAQDKEEQDRKTMIDLLEDLVKNTQKEIQELA